MYLLHNAVQSYAWGSTSVIAELTGRTPEGAPEAELWMGAHPHAPSRTARDSDGTDDGGDGGDLVGLDEVISGNPEGILGARTVARFGQQLPFLLKVLAADKPLSLQAHPSLDEARAGFDAEERSGIPRSSPSRNYKDRNHKPELLCALTPFEALCGFRSRASLLELVEALGSGELRAELAGVGGGDHESGERAEESFVRGAFERLLNLPADRKGRLLSSVIAACQTCRSRGGAFAGIASWVPRLASLYPGDVGAVVALLLEHVVLPPGEAIYLPAGNMHAYLCGAGIEIMASSDNVLRGGLTPKHVDVPELLRVLRFAPAPVPRVSPRRVSAQEEVYDTPAPDFRLSRLVVESGKPFQALPAGPEIVLVIEGTLTATLAARRESKLALAKGASVFFGAGDGYSLDGDAIAFRARVGLDEY